MDAHVLDDIVAKLDLNEHPFYRAWQKGTLPRSALAAYAADYASFIETIELGWRRAGEEAHADVEREHAGMWRRFREALQPHDGAPCVEAVALAETARRVFAEPDACIGALYAFEAQQPSTAK